MIENVKPTGIGGHKSDDRSPVWLERPGIPPHRNRGHALGAREIPASLPPSIRWSAGSFSVGRIALLIEDIFLPRHHLHVVAMNVDLPAAAVN